MKNAKEAIELLLIKGAYADYYLSELLERRGEDVKELLKPYIEANTDDAEGNMPLSRAIKEGHIDEVQQLLRLNANPNTTNPCDFNTPLNLSVCNGSAAIVKLLLEAHADANFSDYRNSEQIYPIFNAVSKGFQDIVALLLKHGADLNIEIDNVIFGFISKITPFDRTMQCHQSDMSAYLLSAQNSDGSYKLKITPEKIYHYLSILWTNYACARSYGADHFNPLSEAFINRIENEQDTQYHLDFLVKVLLRNILFKPITQEKINIDSCTPEDLGYLSEKLCANSTLSNWVKEGCKNDPDLDISTVFEEVNILNLVFDYVGLLTFEMTREKVLYLAEQALEMTSQLAPNAKSAKSAKIEVLNNDISDNTYHDIVPEAQLSLESAEVSLAGAVDQPMNVHVNAVKCCVML